MPDVARAPRIAPLHPPYAPEIDAALRRWMPPGVDLEPLKLFRTLNVHSELASRMRPLGSVDTPYPAPPLGLRRRWALLRSGRASCRRPLT